MNAADPSKNFPDIRCSECGGAFLGRFSGEPRGWVCEGCNRFAPGNELHVDLESKEWSQTADHYSLQWGDELGFLEFLRKRPGAKSVLAAARLGWNALIYEIRERAQQDLVKVYDAACGFGGVANELLAEPVPNQLRYVGADIHQSLMVIPKSLPDFGRHGFLVRWDISKPLPSSEIFDYVICRASLHHTPDPAKTFQSLSASLAPGGKLAISVYKRKSVCREAVDEALRALITQMPREEAFETCRQFTVLGRALQDIKQQVELPEDIPLLGLKAGKMPVQELIYYHLLKCFFNPEFGDKYSTLVNFDWYHPQFAYRYDIEQVHAWFKAANLNVIESTSSAVQHYVVGQRGDDPRLKTTA